MVKTNIFKYSLYEMLKELKNYKKIENFAYKKIDTYSENLIDESNENNDNIYDNVNSNKDDDIDVVAVAEIIPEEKIAEEKIAEENAKTIMGINYFTFMLLLVMNLFFFFLTIVWIARCSPVMSNFARIGLWTLVVLGLFIPGFSFLAFIGAISYRYNTECRDLKACIKKNGSIKCKGKKGKWE